LRRGYCEQFAGTFAALARAVGLPSRVAVGFTPGVAENGTYVVRGRNAHAWPEVWFDRLGWVSFEPTPGRGEPGAQNYTGVAPAQDQTVNPDPSVTTPASSGPLGASAAGEVPGVTDSVPTAAAPAPGRAIAASVAWSTVGVLMLAVAMAGLALTALRRRTRQRRGRQAEPGLAVLEAWAAVRTALSYLGMTTSAAETVQEFAARTSTIEGVDSAAALELAVLVTATTFGPSGANPDDARQAWVLAAGVIDGVRRRLHGVGRVRAALDWRLVSPPR